MGAKRRREGGRLRHEGHEAHEGHEEEEHEGEPKMFTGSLSPAEEKVMTRAIGCGIAVHRVLGPGFKECIYHQALRLELESQGLRFESDKDILVKYKEWSIPGQRIDLIVERLVLVELKAVPKLREFHRDQVISYLKTTGLRAGLLLNFHAPVLKAGLRRIVL
jgi:GxxExxY protein